MLRQQQMLGCRQVASGGPWLLGRRCPGAAPGPNRCPVPSAAAPTAPAPAEVPSHEPSIVQRVLRPTYADNGSETGATVAPAPVLGGGLDQECFETDGARAFRRTSFTFQHWRKHRSTQRYIYHLRTINASRIVRGLLLPVTIICSFATVVCAYHTAHASGWLSLLPALPLVPVEPFQLTSFALALLLVFRTNTSYQRWHDARCVFGRIADAARDTLRQALAVFPRANPAGRSATARWLVAFCYASKWALREDGRQRADLEGWLEPEELDAMMAAPDSAHYAILVLSHTLRTNLARQPMQLAKMMDGIGSMMYDLSSCNRILTTPIPLSYTRHTTRFMVLWLLLLPLALWAKCGWGTVPAVALVSLALLTIEAIGVSLEEPFSILALETICDNLRRSVTSLTAMDDAAHQMAVSIAGSTDSQQAQWRHQQQAEEEDEDGEEVNATVPPPAPTVAAAAVVLSAVPGGALPAAATARPGGAPVTWR